MDAVGPLNARRSSEPCSNGPAKGMVLDSGKPIAHFVGIEKPPTSEPVQARGPLGDTDELAARDIVQDYINQIISSRDPEQDVTPEELARRDNMDDFINTYLLNTRDLGTQPEIQARSLPDGQSETVARDDAAGDFINALLKNRDSPDFPRDLLSLASLASRVFDE